MDKAGLLNELKAVRNLSTPGEEARFYSAVDQLEYHDNSLLPDILYIFNDDVANPEPFKYLANRVATLNDALVIKYLVEGALDLIPVAKMWMKLFYYSLLDENIAGEWVDNLRKSSPSIRAAVFDLFDELAIQIVNRLSKPITQNYAQNFKNVDEERLYVFAFVRGAFAEDQLY